MRTAIFYIPSNIDLETLIQEHKPKFSFKKEKLLYLISLIPDLQSFDYEKSDTNDGYVAINATKIRASGIRDFPKYREWLVEVGIWEVDMSYQVNVRSRRYRLKEPYNQGLKCIELDKTVFIKKVLQCSDEQSDSIKKHKALHFWMNGLEIDHSGAQKFIEDKLVEDKAVKAENYTRKYNTRLISVSKIQNKRFLFVVDDTIGRLHTNLTTIKSDLRNFITYQGKQLVSVDIKNSQPLIATLLLNPLFWLPKVIELEEKFTYNSCSQLILNHWVSLFEDVNPLYHYKLFGHQFKTKEPDSAKSLLRCYEVVEENRSNSNNLKVAEENDLLENELGCDSESTNFIKLGMSFSLYSDLFIKPIERGDSIRKDLIEGGGRS